MGLHLIKRSLSLRIKSFELISIYLLQRSLDGDLVDQQSTIRRKYSKIIPPEILDKFLTYIMAEMRKINLPQLFKWNALLGEKLSAQEKSEFLGILIHFCQEDRVLTAITLQELKQIAFSIQVNERDFTDILGRFAPGVKVVDPHYFYVLLGVERGANSTEIKKAYHRMASRFHPDLFTHHTPEEQAAAEKKFIEIHQAYQTLR